MEVNEQFDERAADRLLTGEFAPDEVAAGYRQVATLISATRAEPSAAELSRQADTVRAMAAARRGAGEGIVPPATWALRLARRRSIRLGVLAAATTLSFTTGLAAKGLLPGPLQSIASRVLPSLGDSPPDSDGGQGATGGSPEDPSNRPGPEPGSGPGPAEGGGTVPAGAPGAPAAKTPGQQQEPQLSPGQAKQSAKTTLRVEATTSGGRLVVSFQESGLGSDAVMVIARADTTATYGCVSQDGKNQKPHKGGPVSGVSEARSRFAVVNGQSHGALTLAPAGPASVSCPSGEAPQLLRVLYSRVVVVDTTTGTSTTINRAFPADA